VAEEQQRSRVIFFACPGDKRLGRGLDRADMGRSNAAPVQDARGGDIFISGGLDLNPQPLTTEGAVPKSRLVPQGS
jgi:hypothetical protein